MKAVAFLVVALWAISPVLLTANTWRVNNQSNTDPDFTSLQDAHDAASNGDTILVEGSPIKYGGLSSEKRLVIIGPGFLLDENPNAPVTQSAIINGFVRFNRNDSNDPSGGSSGSEVYGLVFESTVSVFTDNVVIARSRVVRITIDGPFSNDPGATGVQVFSNLFSSGISSDAGPLINIQILNNIFESNLSLPAQTSGAVLNNLILGNTVELSSFVGEIRNNIVTTTSADNVNISVTGSPDLLSHNVGGNDQHFGSGTNENITADTGDLFIGPNGSSTDGQWQLQANSPASGNGSDDTDRGPFGGVMPYRLSGLGTIPVITSLQVQPVGSPDSSLQVRIIAISSN